MEDVMSADGKYTERELDMEVRLARIESSIAQLQAAIDRLEAHLREMSDRHDEERREFRRDIESLKHSRTQIMTWVAAAAFFGGAIVELVRKLLGL